MATSFANWQSPSSSQESGMVSGTGPTPVFRSAKDQRISAFGVGPDTQYPDGYLGTMSSNRRQDKLTNAAVRANQRAYSRGVHKGERINAGDYIWPQEFNLLTGVMLESKGKKFAPPGAEPVRLTNDGKAGPRGIPRGLERPDKQIIDMQRRSMLKSLAPMWK